MNQQQEAKNIDSALNQEELKRAEAIMYLAVYELEEITEKYINSTLGQIILQSLAVDIRKLLDEAPKTESLVQTEKNFSRLENIIFKRPTNHKEK